MLAPSHPVRWLSLPVAADQLGLTAGALRKLLERHAVRAPDGGVEALVDGVRARKLGRLWRVSLSPAWADPVPTTPKKIVGSASSQKRADDREGTRS